ncbi:MAG: FHA domain-containing protein [Cyanobacteria bacterium]|nr:FHA domain-containing protein [Cyanobacteria bacterium GSL.Bin1]
MSEPLDSVVRELTEIEHYLAKRKVTMQIVSQDLSLAEVLYNVVSTDQTLTSACQINYSHLPDVPQRIEPEYKGYLSLRQFLSEEGTESWQRYELLATQEYQIGRDENCAIALPASHYRGISQHHATIRFVGEKEGEGIWELCDFNSRNGTFINGQPIKGSQQIVSGDKIHLGFPESKPQIAEFSFDSYFEVPDYSASPLYWECINCDFLVMVVNSCQPLTSEEENFLQKLDSTLIHKPLIVADIPSPNDSEEEKLSSEHSSRLQNWLDQQTLQKEFELITVCLQLFYEQDTNQSENNPDFDQLPKSLKKAQANFFKSLENFVKRQPENILAQRLSKLTLPLLEPIDQALSKQEEKLDTKLEQVQSKLEGIATVNLKEMGKKVITEVNEDKDRFFKQVKIDFTRSKEQLLFLPHKDSVSYQLHTIVQELDSIILKKEGMCYIQLSTPESAESREINQKLLKFICQELRRWAYAEWEKILNTYGNGGLKGLYDRSHQNLNIFPNLLPESPFPSTPEIDIENILMGSFMEHECDSHYKQVSFAGYLMKQLRSNLMQIMMMVTMGSAFIGLGLGRQEISDFVGKHFTAFPPLFGVVIALIYWFFSDQYNQEQKLKIQETTEKLKNKLLSYYQSLLKSLLDKIFQELTLKLEEEERSFRDALKLVNETYEQKILEKEKEQNQYKAQMEELKTQQNELKKQKEHYLKLSKALHI